MSEQEQYKFSSEEKERIEQLPIKRFGYGNQVSRGHYDEQEATFYDVDENGKLKGTFSKINDKSQIHDDLQSPPPPPEPKQTPSNADRVASLDTFHDPPLESEKDEEQDIRSKVAGFLRSISANRAKDHNQEEGTINTDHKKKILIFAAVCIVILFTVGSLVGSSSPTQSQQEPAQSTEESSDELSRIIVVQVTRDMIPGEIITRDDIQESSISAESYNEITLGDSKLYQWDRAESLIDKYVISYIPKGQYLTYDNIASVYTPEPNPWLDSMEGYETVSIPIPEELIGNEKLNYGSVVNLSITKRTVNEANLGTEDNENNVDGLSHDKSVEQSYIIDTYSLESTICDLLNDKGDSLYETYCSWLAIPAGEQASYLKTRFVEDEALIQTIEPMYLVIKVTEAQADELGDILSDDSDVKITFTNTINANTDTRAGFVAEINALFKTIGDAETAAQREIQAQEREQAAKNQSSST